MREYSQESSENSGENTCFRELLQVEVCFRARVEFCVLRVLFVSCVLYLSVRGWVEFETSRSRVEVRLGSRISQTEVDTPTKLCFFLFYPVSCCCFSTFFFSFLFFWLHFAHKNTNMATERRLHLFHVLLLFCYFFLSFFFHVEQRNLFFVCWN